MRDRLAACHTQTTPLNAHDDSKVVLKQIDAMRPIAEIQKEPGAVVGAVLVKTKTLQPC